MKPQSVNTVCSTLIVLLCFSLILSPIFDTVPYLRAQTQENCEAILAEAETKYQDGLIDEAIALVNRCLNKAILVFSFSYEGRLDSF